MAKLTLEVDPTFPGKVEIPVPGKSPVKVEFTFKHRTRDELQKFIAAIGDLDDVQMIMALASGWELADDFTEVNIRSLTQLYIAAPGLIFEKYLQELTGTRLKN